MIEYIPIATTLFGLFFLYEITGHYQQRKTAYLRWWALGVLTFIIGTATESWNALVGWQPLNFRLWYVSGALLGGYPLAQGSVYLLMPEKFARSTSLLLGGLIVVAGTCVFLSPLELPPDFSGKLSGSVLGWKWVRGFSPLINLYAFVFLVGGAAFSAWKYAAQSDQAARFKGNLLIAVGALLPGVGGTFTRMGYVNVLFVTELIGLVLIYLGYRVIKQRKTVELAGERLEALAS